jgi:hypothetical protein
MATIKKAQSGRLLKSVLSRVVKKPAVDKAIDYGKVILTDAQKAKNAEILKNPGSATAKSWSNAKSIAKKETKAKYKASDTKYLEQSNKPMLKRPGSPRTETLGERAKSINKAKNGMWMQKAAASIKKRGTAGKCTPITKPGCTGRAKALAKTFKKIAKSNKKK